MTKILFTTLNFLGASLYLCAATFYCSPNGNDNTGSGALNSPFRNVARAIDEASAGDVIELRGGSYPSNEIRINKSNLTIRSYNGEWARIEAPTNVEDIASCIWYNEPDVNGGLLENLEIVGGYYYGVKFETNWDWGLSERYGVSHITLRNCDIHHTGRDCVKITPACDHIYLIGCSLHHSGVGISNSPDNGGPNAEGIDNVNGSNMIVRNCHIHHTSTSGVYAKGGARNCLIENNLVTDTGEGGILLGFYTDAEWFDTTLNPNFHECIGGIARNNIVLRTGGTGIGCWGSLDCGVYNNTIATASPAFHAAIQLDRADVWIDDVTTANAPNINLTIQNNIVIDQSPATDDDYTVEVREGALGSNININQNVYHKTSGAASFSYQGNWPAFTWTEWQSAGYDNNGTEANPMLDAQYHLTNSSNAAIDQATAINGIGIDYDGNSRTGTPDCGADEFGAGNNLPVPPTVAIGTGLGSGIILSADAPAHTDTWAIEIHQVADIAGIYELTLPESAAAIATAPLWVMTFDMQGRTVTAQPLANNQSAQIDLSHAPRGWYIVQITTRTGAYQHDMPNMTVKIWR